MEHLDIFTENENDEADVYKNTISGSNNLKSLFKSIIAINKTWTKLALINFYSHYGVSVSKKII